jgi:hypothetical protein
VGSATLPRYIGGMMRGGVPPDDPGGDAAADADAERRAGA